MTVSEEVAAEREWRIGAWRSLLSEFPDSGIVPQALRERGIYGGGAGTYVNKARTRRLSGDSDGVTVSVLHNGFSYPDDISDDCLLYHYPETGRPGITDESEV